MKENKTGKKPFSRSRLIKELSWTCELSQVQVNSVLETLVTIARREARNTFILPGICKLDLVRRKPRKIRNPRTGETLMLPERDALRITAPHSLKIACVAPIPDEPVRAPVAPKPAPVAAKPAPVAPKPAPVVAAPAAVAAPVAAVAAVAPAPAPAPAPTPAPAPAPAPTPAPAPAPAPTPAPAPAPVASAPTPAPAPAPAPAAPVATPEPTPVQDQVKTEEEAPVPVLMPMPHAKPAAEQPAEPVAEQPVEPVAEQPAEPVAEQPAESVAEQPAEPVAEQPVEPVAEQPVEPVAEQPVEPVAEQPLEPVAEQPVEPVAEQPVEPVAEPVAEQPAEVAQEPEQPVDPDALISFRCPRCHQEVEATGDMVGVETECPTCGNPITVPAQSESNTIHSPDNNGANGPVRHPQSVSQQEAESLSPDKLKGLTIRIDVGDLGLDEPQPAVAEAEPQPDQMISFFCSACNQEIEASRDMIGEATVCPGCGSPIIVPAESAANTIHAMSQENEDPRVLQAMKGRTMRIDLGDDF